MNRALFYFLPPSLTVQLPDPFVGKVKNNSLDLQLDPPVRGHYRESGQTSQ
jgi:hypothetical protein